MIPSTNDDLQVDFEIEQSPTKTYRLDLVNLTIAGSADGIEAMRQAIYKILNTERYDHMIYSWNYGVEFGGLFGEPTSLTYPEIKRSITEALLHDERIMGVDEFAFTSVKGVVSVQFTVHTTEGDIEIGKVVNG